jgi:hypothetical protein
MQRTFFFALAAGLLALTAFTAPAAAGDGALRFGLGVGNHHSKAFDLYWQYSFDPWLDKPDYQLTPFANLGLTHWKGDSADDAGVKFENDSIWGLVAALGLRYSLTCWEAVHPYLALSAGPSYISDNTFLDRDLGGGHYIFNLRASLGLSFGEEYRHRLSLDASHYSNAFTQRDNNGFNYLGASYGFSF